MLDLLIVRLVSRLSDVRPPSSLQTSYYLQCVLLSLDRQLLKCRQSNSLEDLSINLGNKDILENVQCFYMRILKLLKVNLKLTRQVLLVILGQHRHL